MTENDPEKAIRAISRRSFVIAGVATAATLAGWQAVLHAREQDGLEWPLRRILRGNERIVRGVLGTSRLAPLLTPDRIARPARVNGDLGLDPDFDPATWTLAVESGTTHRELGMDDIRKLPRCEIITELHCIEGWSLVVHWAGARFADFVEAYTPYGRGEPLPRYVGLWTPDEAYYVGLDIESAMHPQTLLCYEMNGEPLTMDHGAPLRLAIPVKYGVKNLKRIGKIRFSDMRPDDYWAQRGYDWYAGL